MYRAAWRKGLKTTYYLRTLGASNIEKATVSMRKETRGIVAQGDEAVVTPSPADTGDTVSPIPGAAAAKRTYTEAEVKACSLDAMLNGGTCEACQ
jgi:ribonucleoside-diphosphate reductase alpha chain